MRKNKTPQPSQNEYKIRRSTIITVIGDALIILALLLCLLTYISKNNINTFQQNVKNITSIANAKSELMLAALDNSSQEVKSAYRYCNGKILPDILDFLAKICDTESEYQILKLDDAASAELYYVYCGYSTRKTNGEYQEVQYANTDLSTSLYLNSTQQNGEISYSQSFTNRTDGLRYFAAFCGISVEENGELSHYYLVKPQKESRVLDQLEMYSQYSELHTAICYEDGKYLARDLAYQSANFYDYIADYNRLSMDEKNAVRSSVQEDSDGSGYLTYHDNNAQDCIFAYVACGDSRTWHIIVSVPESVFVSSELISFFPMIIIIFLAILLAFNTWRLLIIVKELRMSVERERIANSSKSSFLSRMSHEIRTPLNAVIGYNALARTDLNKTRNLDDFRQTEMKVMDCLEKSELASKHLLAIINDVLDMSAIESGKMTIVKERFDFKGLITSLTTVFYSQARAKGVTLDVVLHTLTEEWFIGDQMRTNQILTNLLSNAIKFTAEGGSVTLTIIQPEATKNAAHIHFEVTDTGIGMTEEYMTHIWTPFEQADSSIKRRFGGTGLGLSIMKNLVDLMGGSIQVRSQVGIGTTFEVDLTYEQTEQPANLNAYDFSTVNALVVDDDVNTCNYIKLLFNRCGARCISVTSGADALDAVALAEKSGEHYNICLIDWKMPKMDGIDTVHAIRSLVGNKLPIIVLTAYDYSELAEKITDTDAIRFLSKPLFQSTLFNLLSDINGVPILKPSNPDNPMIGFGGSRILLVEDMKINMELSKSILETMEIETDCAWNGQEAVQKFENSAPGTYAAILMDVHMPIMNGHEATRMIRSSSHADANSIPIIAMTADAFAENVAEAHASGMNDHIAKPIEISLVYAMLNKYIKRPQ